MARMRFSPYGPRPRRSTRLVICWFIVLVLVFALTLYLTTRDGEKSQVDTRYVLDKVTGRQAVRGKKIQV